MHHIQRSNWDLCQARSASLPVQKDTGHFAICPAAVRGWAIATLTLAVAPRLVSRVIAKGAHITILFVFTDCPHCRRRWSRWSRWRRRRWSRWRRWRSRGRCTTALHPNICAVYELLPLVVAHGLSRIAARKAGKISVEATGAPPSRFQLVPVAAVSSLSRDMDLAAGLQPGGGGAPPTGPCPGTGRTPGTEETRGRARERRRRSVAVAADHKEDVSRIKPN